MYIKVSPKCVGSFYNTVYRTGTGTQDLVLGVPATIWGLGSIAILIAMATNTLIARRLVRLVAGGWVSVTG